MRLFLIILGAHGLVLLFLGIKSSPVTAPHQKICVHTIELRPAAHTIVQAHPKPLTAPSKASTAPPQAQPSKKPAQKKAVKAKSTAEKQPAHGKLKELLEGSLASLEEHQISTTAVDEFKVGALRSEGLATASYEALLATYLKELLELPEQGEVRLLLTLQRDGRVKSCSVVSGSTVNRSYIERQIGSLHLPPFEHTLRNKEVHTFPITLYTQNN